ncbi:MAG TPA: zinc ribbon domain-containing protein [Streptosporangiaceae bacterium]
MWRADHQFLPTSDLGERNTKKYLFGGAAKWVRPGSGPARTGGKRSGSPRTPASGFCLAASCGCRPRTTPGPDQCRPRRQPTGDVWHFARTGRFEPASQLCSACGRPGGPKPLSVREWECAECGTARDRDLNAAKNVLAPGRRERQNACGGNVRPGESPAGPSETGTRRGAA